jgi:DNA-binding NarL/FixJ family response regulator
MRVLVVDDEVLVTDLISDYLKNAGVVSDVYQMTQVNDINAFIRTNSVDLVFLDLYMPNLVGFDILKQIRDEFADVRVVILSSHFEAKNIKKALELKANGYLSKSINKSEILKTLEYLEQDKIYLCTECYRELDLEKMHESNPKFNIKKLLTKREIEVLAEIVAGLTSQEIADKLFVSKETIETHKKHLYEKFAVKKITQLVKIAVENNIV